MRAHPIEDISTLQSLRRGVFLEIEAEIDSRPCTGLYDGELFVTPQADLVFLGGDFHITSE